MANIAKISTAVPKHRFTQEEIFNQSHLVFSKQGFDISPYRSAFMNTEIEHRYSAAPLSWYMEDHSWSDRNRLYIDQSLVLLEEVATSSIESSPLKMEEVTDIVTVSTTGISTPSLDAMLMDRLKFKPHVRRTPVFGLGCAGGLIGLQRANQLALQDPENVVLLLVVELCSLNFMRKETSKQNIIATALFGDGAAGVIVSQKTDGPKILQAMEYRWPDSLSVMGWDVTDEGLSVIFSRSIPDLVRNEFSKVFEDFLKRHGLQRKDIRHFLSHPGGSKVIEQLEKLFHLPDRSMNCTREILRSYGNMSAPTVLFVLKNAMDKGLSGRSLLTTFGPGFTAALLALEL